MDSRESSSNNNKHFICPLSPLSLDRPTTRARTKTPSLDSPCGRHVNVSCWLQAGQQPNNIKLNLQLEHNHNVVKTTDEQQRKRPKLALPDESSHSPHGSTENNGNLDDNDSGESAAIRYLMRGLDAAIAHHGTLLSSPTSIQSNAPAFLLMHPSGQCSPRLSEEAIPCQACKAEASCSLCAALQETNYLPRMQYIRQARKCKSCLSLRTALLKALLLLQHLMEEDMPSTGYKLMDEIPKPGYSLKNRSRGDTISCGERLDIDTSSDTADEKSTS